MKKAFTIIELLVAMGLLSMLIAISGLVFSTAVKAHRAANATGEIAAKLQAITRQLDADFGNGHLQKDGEVLIASMVAPELKRDGTDLDKDGNLIPDRYVSFDRILFFTANGETFQSYNDQTTSSGGKKPVYSTDARVCYSFGKDAENRRAHDEPNPVKRLFCRTQHLYSADTDLPPWLDVASWNQTKAETFNENNFKYEYQTMTKKDWFAMTDTASTDWQAKIDMLFYIAFDTPFGIDMNGDGTNEYGTSSWCQDGDSRLKVDLSAPGATIHQLFMQGVGQFHVQIWQWDAAIGRYRWWPEIDPDGDGIYNEGTTFDDGHTDYKLDGDAIDTSSILGQWFPLFGTFDNTIGPALKFTFTLYDSNGVFPEGKTFTYIVYIN